MRGHFHYCYYPTPEEFRALWDNCIFVPDTNVLLNFYRLKKDSSKKFFSIFESIKDRLWIPYQIGFEFHERRLDVIDSQKNTYIKIIELLEGNVKSIEGRLGEFQKHSVVSVKGISDQIRASYKPIESKLRRELKKHPDLETEDDVLKKITELFDGKVGEQYSKEKLHEIEEESVIRFDKSIPPGYNDKPKFGDLIFWHQIMDKAKTENKPIILITDDRKDDWWEKRHGKTIGPKKQLRIEFQEIAGTSFYMYEPYHFAEYASEYLNITVTPEVISDIKSLKSKGNEAGLSSSTSEVEYPAISSDGGVSVGTPSPSQSVAVGISSNLEYPKVK